MRILIVYCLAIIALPTNGQQYHGILINGLMGTQLYDPFGTPHARGNLDLGLQFQSSRQFGGAAIIEGHLAYFTSYYSGLQ